MSDDLQASDTFCVSVQPVSVAEMQPVASLENQPISQRAIAQAYRLQCIARRLENPPGGDARVISNAENIFLELLVGQKKR